MLQFSLEGIDYGPVSDEDITTIVGFISRTKTMDRTSTWEFIQMEDIMYPYVTQYINDEIDLDEVVGKMKNA